MIQQKIEKGSQVGISKRVYKNEKYYWYWYAIQKVNNNYFVYECEIEENKMACEEDEYEYIKKYGSLEGVKEDFKEKYNISFNELNVCKGNKLFNPTDYNIRQL